MRAETRAVQIERALSTQAANPKNQDTHPDAVMDGLDPSIHADGASRIFSRKLQGAARLNHAFAAMPLIPNVFLLHL